MSDTAEPTLLYLPYDRFLEEVETLAKAIETGASVNVVRDNAALTQAGGMAALLRY